MSLVQSSVLQYLMTAMCDLIRYVLNFSFYIHLVLFLFYRSSDDNMSPRVDILLLIMAP